MVAAELFKGLSTEFPSWKPSKKADHVESTEEGSWSHWWYWDSKISAFER